MYYAKSWIRRLEYQPCASAKQAEDEGDTEVPGHQEILFPLPCNGAFFQIIVPCIMCCECSHIYFVNTLQKLEVESYKYNLYFVHMAGENGGSSRLMVRKIHWKGFREWIFKAMLADLQEDYIFALKHLPTHMVEGPRGSQWFLAEKREKKISRAFYFQLTM